MLRRIAIAMIVTFFTLGRPAPAGFAGSQDPVRAAVDLRQMTDHPEDEPRYVVLAARGNTADAKSVTGHAFIAFWGPDTARRVSVQAAVGLYPAEGEKGVFEKANGELKDEYYDTGSMDAATHLLRIRVTDAQFQKLLGFLRQQQLGIEVGVYHYRLGDSDCMTFVDRVVSTLNRVGGAADIKVADREEFILPQAWIAETIRLNTGTGERDDLPRRVLPVDD